MIGLSDIERAYNSISRYVINTPLLYADSLSKLLGASIYLKCENLQRTGSFKVRGAFNKLLSIRTNGVSAASMGNHAQGVAYAAQRLSMQARIVMPEGVSAVKENAVRAYGAEVILFGHTLSDAIAYAKEQKGYTFIHPYDDEEIISGQGTIGIEIVERLPEFDIAVVPVGGGGLISGVSVALKSLVPDIKIIGVQSESATSAMESFKTGEVIQKTPSPTIADGIAVGRVGSITLGIIRQFVDDIVSVTEGSIAHAIALLMERKKLVVEGAGAVPLAYCLKNKDYISAKRVVLILSGGNIDFTIMDRIIHLGLVESGRVGLIEALIDDQPGSLYRAIGIIAKKQGNIIHILHERLSLNAPIGKTMVGFSIEVRNPSHLIEIAKEMESSGIYIIKTQVGGKNDYS